MLESISLESYSYHNNEEIRKWKQVTNLFARNKNISSQTGDQSVKIVSKIQIKMRFLSSRRKIPHKNFSWSSFKGPRTSHISVSNGRRQSVRGCNRRIPNGKTCPVLPHRGELKLRPEVNTYVLLSAPQVQPRVKFSSCSSKYIHLVDSRVFQVQCTLASSRRRPLLSTKRVYFIRVKILIQTPISINKSKRIPSWKNSFFRTLKTKNEAKIARSWTLIEIELEIKDRTVFQRFHYESK